jgi:hypothetical protein
MDKNLRMFVYMVRHDPAVVIGLVLVGTASTVFFHVTLKLSRVGFRSYVVFSPPRPREQLDYSRGIPQSAQKVRLVSVACVLSLAVLSWRYRVPRIRFVPTVGPFKYFDAYKSPPG